MSLRWVAPMVQLGFLGALAVAWLLVTRVAGVPGLILPDPAPVLAQLIDIITSGDVLEPLLTTVASVATAFAVAAVAGLAIGYLVSRSAYLVDVFDPLLSSINAVPAILFFPLFALLFGLGTGSKIALGATISFFPVVLNTVAGFVATDRVLLQAARAMGASRWHLVRYVLLPSALPVVLVGLRMGLTLSFLAVLGGETIASFGGLGHQIAEASQSMDPEAMYAWILIVIAVAALLNLALSGLQRAGARW